MACSRRRVGGGHCALGGPLEAIGGGRGAIEARSPMLVLDRPLAKRLLGACSQAASDARDGARPAATARAYACPLYTSDAADE